MYYADEVRDFNQVPKGEKVNVSKQELKLGVGAIDKLTSEEFHPEFQTSTASGCWRCSMKEQRQRGNHCTSGSATWRQVVNIMEALKRSMENSGQGETS